MHDKENERKVMLIAKIFIYNGVEEYQIDEIHIQNIEGMHGSDIDDYTIRKPDIAPRDLVIKHQRSKGYKPLLIEALKWLIEREEL